MQIECACGCGMKFKPRNNRHKYYNKQCRKNAYKRVDLGSGISVKGNQVTVKGAKEVLMFMAGLY